ncbi:NADH:ubiquinone oxidoreductase subunit C [Streptomyces luteogriseus]|uniref:NADH-quinone oxidoreductase subunit C n=1 Tax=Streptomyces luteogriseus TaxID=68233 RepID=UPI00278198D2|nr:NADH-quinone oxidoreductase subunit C [Streptomyces luteogriseus]MDQ0715511.1 NADH:ubiquinone oxidoreductase subunit C [Streptomyces luteogriseus]
MTAVGWLPADAEELFGTDATAEESYDVLTVDVPPAAWITALEIARDRLGCTYFDWLSAVDEPGTGFRVTAHVAALSPLRRLLLRTTIPHEAPALPSAVGVFAGAAWHERETYEMFGVTFEGHPALDHLLLPENFEGHPLRKDFVLAARVAKAWPGAKEPGESEHGGPKRRQMLPPGVPDPNEWGPLKGQLPPAPARGAGRTAGDRPTRGAARPAGERPVRRARSVSEGSASQSATGAETPAGGAGASADARRARSAAEGSVSQSAADAGTPTGGAGASAGGAGASTRPRRARSAAEGSASQSTPGESTAPASAGPRRNRSASQGSASQQRGGPAAPEPGPASATPGSASPTSDAPWHHARPAFDEPAPETAPEAAKSPAPEPSDGSQTSPTSEPAEAPESTTPPESPDAPESSSTSESPDAPESSSTPESPDAPESSSTSEIPDAADAQDPATGPQPTDDNVKPAGSPSKPDNPEDPAGGPQ